MRPGDIIRNEVTGQLGQYQGVNIYGYGVVLVPARIHWLAFNKPAFYAPVVLRLQFSTIFSVN